MAPKVNSDYVDNKKKQILDAAFKVFQQKPLYEMTMLDVIKEAGLSKGGIYRYFSDIDELIIALINRVTAKNNYKHKIDEIITVTETAAGKIEALFTFLGNYIKESPIALGKIQFELTVLIANHPEKKERMFCNLTEQENGQYLVGTLLNMIMEGVSSGEFEPGYPLNDIFTYITTSIDGLIKSVVLQKCYSVNAGNIDVVNIMKIISDSVLHLIAKK